MELESLRITIQTIGNYLGLIVAPTTIIILVIRIILEFKKTENWNKKTISLLLIFIPFAWTIIWTGLYESTELKDILIAEIIGNSVGTVSFFSLGVGFMITTSLCKITYVNHWTKIYFVPIIVFVGILVYSIIFNFYLFYSIYFYLGGLLALIFFYYTGFRLKNNNSLGMGLFFTFSFLGLIFGEEIPGQIFNILFLITGLIISMGYFAPFKIKDTN